MSKKEIRTKTFLAFFIGVVVGFLFAPIKAGIGDITNNYYNNDN